jgi:predicted Zn-dependent protease
MRLEQTAFGSVYPEHELDDRLDHLEREVLGTNSSGSIVERISKLEGKLSGGSAFASSAQPPVAITSGAYRGNAGDNTVAYAGQAPGTVPQHGAGGSSAGALTRTPKGTSSTSRPKSGPPPAAAAGGPQDADAIINAIPFDNAAGDYFSQIRRYPGGYVVRWQTFPLRIRLPQDSPQSWTSGLELGMKKWGQFIPMKVAPANEAAEIEVVWVNHLPPRQLGITRLQQVVSGTPQVIIYMLRPTYYLPEIPERTLQPVFLHELGHAVGIFGHSDSDKDIMQPSELGLFGAKRSSKGTIKVQFGGISARDLNTLKRIYQTPALPANFNVTQPVEWSFFMRSGSW